MKNGLLWVGFLVVVVAQGAARIDNSEELRHKYGLSPEFDGLPLHNVKIAILDKGFSGSIKREKNGKWKAADGMLPKSAVVVEDYAKLYGNECSGSKGPVSFAESEHGGVVAQTAWAVAGRDPLGPKFYLLNTNGLPNFRCAVRYAREVAKVDIIVYSHNFEYGGNFDGKGFINAIVNEATADGILWFNAAGNYAGQVYNGPAKDDITLHVRSNVSENKVSIKAAWSGASDFVEIGSKNDYDLLVFQPDGTPIPVKNYKQVVKKTPPKKKKVEPDAASDKVLLIVNEKLFFERQLK